MVILIFIVSCLNLFLLLKLWIFIGEIRKLVRESEEVLDSYKDHNEKTNVLLHHLDILYGNVYKKYDINIDEY